MMEAASTNKVFKSTAAGHSAPRDLSSFAEDLSTREDFTMKIFIELQINTLLHNTIKI